MRKKILFLVVAFLFFFSSTIKAHAVGVVAISTPDLIYAEDNPIIGIRYVADTAFISQNANHILKVWKGKAPYSSSSQVVFTDIHPADKDLGGEVYTSAVPFAQLQYTPDQPDYSYGLWDGADPNTVEQTLLYATNSFTVKPGKSPQINLNTVDRTQILFQSFPSYLHKEDKIDDIQVMLSSATIPYFDPNKVYMLAVNAEHQNNFDLKGFRLEHWVGQGDGTRTVYTYTAKPDSPYSIVFHLNGNYNAHGGRSTSISFLLRDAEPLPFRLFADGADTSQEHNGLYDGTLIVHPPQNTLHTGAFSLSIKACQLTVGQPATLDINNIDPDQAYALWYDNRTLGGGSTLANVFHGKFPKEEITTETKDGQTVYTAHHTIKPGSDEANKPVKNIGTNGESGNNTICIHQGDSGLGGNIAGYSCDYRLAITVNQFATPDTDQKSCESNIAGDPSGLSATYPQPDYSEPPDPSGPCTKQSGVFVCKTAIGNIATTASTFFTTLFSLMLGVSGGIALLIIIFAGFQYMTSSGDPEKVKNAREMITNAIIGLLFMIFSLVILEVIGVDLLHLDKLHYLGASTPKSAVTPSGGGNNY